jgi:hypothetical protein
MGGTVMRYVILGALVLLVGSFSTAQVFGNEDASPQGQLPAQQQKVEEQQFNVRMRLTWVPKNDAVEKQTSLSISLEDQSKKFVGLVEIGCDTGASPNLFFKLALLNEFHWFSTNAEGDYRGRVIAFYFSNSTTAFKPTLQAVTLQRKENSLLGVIGHSGILSDDQMFKYGMNEATYVKLLFHELHKDKNFDIVIHEGRDKRSRISIRQPATLSEANNKLFETIAAYCIDAVPDFSH